MEDDACSDSAGSKLYKVMDVSSVDAKALSTKVTFLQFAVAIRTLLASVGSGSKA